MTSERKKTDPGPGNNPLFLTAQQERIPGSPLEQLFSDCPPQPEFVQQTEQSLRILLQIDYVLTYRPEEINEETSPYLFKALRVSRNLLVYSLPNTGEDSETIIRTYCGLLSIIQNKTNVPYIKDEINQHMSIFRPSQETHQQEDSEQIRSLEERHSRAYKDIIDLLILCNERKTAKGEILSPEEEEKLKQAFIELITTGTRKDYELIKVLGERLNQYIDLDLDYAPYTSRNEEERPLKGTFRQLMRIRESLRRESV